MSTPQDQVGPQFVDPADDGGPPDIFYGENDLAAATPGVGRGLIPIPDPTTGKYETRSALEAMALRGQVWDPWSGPPQPHWYSGMGFSEDTAYLGPLYRALEAAGAGAAKGEELLGGFYHAAMEGYGALARSTGSQYLESDAAKGLSEAQSIEQDAQARVRALTPDPATTGAAVQLLHGVVSGAYRMTVGSLVAGPVGGAALLGGSEAVSRYHELTQQGVDTTTAAESAAGTGVLQGAAALVPGGFGSSLISRLLTGAGANVGMGLAGRYADHAILAANGYKDMADQERVWDGGQLMADAVLGAAFGGLAHLHAGAEQARMLETTQNLAEASGAADAARVMELAAADRRAAPGVPVDPQSAGVHHAALETAIEQLLVGDRVNVADVPNADSATFLERPARDTSDLEQLYHQTVANTLRDAGVFDEQQSLADLEAQLTARMRPSEQPSTWAAPAARPADASYATQKLWEMAVLDRPDMQVPGRFTGEPPTLVPAGTDLEDVHPSEAASQTVNAGDALRQVNDNVAQAEKSVPQALEAAGNCAARRGFGATVSSLSEGAGLAGLTAATGAPAYGLSKLSDSSD